MRTAVVSLALSEYVPFQKYDSYAARATTR